MNIKIIKLSVDHLALAKQFFIWNQTDENVESPVILSDKYLLTLLSNNFFHAFVALDNEAIIGGVMAYELPMYSKEETEMFLYEIGVEEAYRKKGVATQLIHKIKEVCNEKGINTMFVGSSLDNHAAKQLYKSTDGRMELIPWFTYNLDDNENQ